MKQKTTVVVFILSVCLIFLQACQPAGVAGTPPLFFVADGKLYQQVNDTSEMIADLMSIGEVYSAVRIGDNLFILSGTGLHMVDINTKSVAKTSVIFEEDSSFGSLLRTPDPNVLIYSNAAGPACNLPNRMGMVTGLYRIKEDAARVIFTTEDQTAKILGMTADQKRLYGYPESCDPAFERFWMISTADGNIEQEFLTWKDVGQEEYAWWYASLSPNAQYIAFMSYRIVEQNGSSFTDAYRLSLYNLNDQSIKRYEFPNPPSSASGNLLWSPDNRKVYFPLNVGSPTVADENYGLWSFDVSTGEFSQITKQFEQLPIPVSITLDGQWLLFQAEQTAGYVNLRTGEQIKVPISVKGLKLVFW
jgi:hypothetical protein